MSDLLLMLVPALTGVLGLWLGWRLRWIAHVRECSRFYAAAQEEAGDALVVRASRVEAMRTGVN